MSLSKTTNTYNRQNWENSVSHSSANWAWYLFIKTPFLSEIISNIHMHLYCIDVFNIYEIYFVFTGVSYIVSDMSR